jgi:hypothetical protein
LHVTKGILAHGEYTHWLDIEFGLSDRMAQRFVNVYARLGAKTDIMSVLPPTTLYLLAAPSTPDEAIRAVEAQLDTGERMSVAYVQGVITQAKLKARVQSSPPALLGGELTDDANAEDDGRCRARSRQPLEATLATVINLLGGQAIEDWETLCQNDELRQLCNELVRLKSILPRL